MPYAAGLAYQDYTLHNVGVRVCWDDPVLAPHLQTLCMYFGLRVASAALAAPPVTLTFVTEATGLSIPSEACHVAAQAGVHAWHAASHLYFSDGQVTVQLDPGAGTGIATLPPAAGDALQRVRKDLVLYSLLCLMRARGLYALHAAGVAKDEDGVLLVAASRSGKSTLAFSLVRQGWGHLSDDAILLRVRGDRIEALPLRRDVCFEPAAARHFPDIVAHWQPCVLAEDGKQQVNMAALYPERLRSTCLPRWLIFPRIVAAPVSQLHPMGKAEALLHLIRQSVLVGLEPQRVPLHLDILKRLVNQTSRYQLLAGQDLGRNPALIAALLADVTRSSCQRDPGGIA